MGKRKRRKDNCTKLAAWCRARIRELTPKIGTDEILPVVDFFNQKAKAVVSQLVQRLTRSGFGNLIAEIDIGSIRSIRQSVAILSQWERRLETQLADPKARPRRVADQDDGQWTKIYSPAELSKLFGVSWDTLKRRFRDNSIRFRKLSTKSYQIHVADMPK